MLKTKCLHKRKHIDIFSDIYRSNYWDGKDSRSGIGSDFIHTTVIRQEIPLLLRDINAKSLLDAPCSDFYWMKNMNPNVGRYIGADIVTELIAENQRKHGDGTRKFVTLDIINDDIPKVDIILCRDCLVHLSFKDIISTIMNFKKSGSTYLLTTTFTKCLKNRDIATGNWRTINMQYAPFNFPEPVKLIDEKYTGQGGKYSDKSLAIWKLENIKM